MSRCTMAHQKKCWRKVLVTWRDISSNWWREYAYSTFGHTGLPEAEIFTKLESVKEGDIFLIHVLNETLAYKVDQIKVVEPSETDDLKIVPGYDYATLVTCTPYGINSHRLLVEAFEQNIRRM